MTVRPEPFDPGTGEVLPHTERAADGFMVPAASASAGSFLDLIEDGRFSAEAYAEIKDLGEYLMHRATVTEKPAKGKVTLTVEMEADGDSFKMVPKIAVKKPEAPRQRSTAWQDDRGNFTRFPPNQRQFFGVRNVEEDAPRPVRTVG
jgi:hypothetical protein